MYFFRGARLRFARDGRPARRSACAPGKKHMQCHPPRPIGSVMKARWALVAVGALLLAGCRHYRVEERALDAYAAMPANEKQKVALGTADGRWVRGRDAKPEALIEGSQRRVRVLKPQTVAGLVFVIAAAAW